MRTNQISDINPAVSATDDGPALGWPMESNVQDIDTPTHTDEQRDHPLRVLVVSESSLEQTNGVSGSVKHVLEHLATLGFRVSVLTPEPAPENGTYAGFPVSTVTSWPIQNFNVVIPTKKSVIRMIRKGARPDVIHIASPISRLGHGALIAGERLGIPTVAIYQTDVDQYARRFATQALGGTADETVPHHTGWLRHVSKAAGDRAEQLVSSRIAKLHNEATLTLAPTNQARQRLESFGVDPERIRLWGRGVDTALFNPGRRTDEDAMDLHRKWSHDGSVIVVGYVGRLAPEKRIDRLAVLDGLGLQLVVVGGGPDEHMLRERLPHAIFTGMLHGSQLANAYAALDIFVHTGTEETFGQTIQEAMASGIPVVAPARGGPVDLIESGATGLLYAPFDDTDLRACVQHLISDDHLRRELGEAGFSTVHGRTWPALVDELIGDYALAVRAAKTEHN